MARSGRRPGDSGTREAILAAARAAFGELGYDRATIRHIAGQAGVDPALVHHYYATKADLYATAIDIPLAPSAVLPLMLAGDRAEFGERITRMFFSVWESPKAREPLLGMLRGAFGGHDPGTAGFREFVTSGLVGQVAAAVGGPSAELRVELAVSQLVGIAVLRYVVGVEPLASADVDKVVALVAPRIQGCLDAG
jgi:AcrR family transcriptional regulator